MHTRFFDETDGASASSAVSQSEARAKTRVVHVVSLSVVLKFTIGRIRRLAIPTTREVNIFSCRVPSRAKYKITEFT